MRRHLLSIVVLFLASHLSAAPRVTVTIKLAGGADAAGAVHRINEVLGRRHAAASPLFRQRGPELDRFVRVTFADRAAMEDALLDLEALDGVDSAEPDDRPAPPPAVDISPMTPSLVWTQSYRTAAPLGLGFRDVQSLPGADANGIRIADVENGWIAGHEDLDAPASVDGTIHAEDIDHGAAVAGILAAVDNAYGISGVAPRAALSFVSPYAADGTYNLPDAIATAASHLRRGDVLLIEQQVYCYTDFCPAEWNRAAFAAIRNAVQRGIVVVEPAGNGSFDLDEPRFATRLGANGDSGAIVVGAGTSSASHDALALSNHGARVDLQGFGENVVTLGYGDAFNPTPDPRQRYTMRFSGTSSASAMVAGAAAVLQSIRIRQGLPPLDSVGMRTALVSSGTQQGSGGHIGPLPNLASAVKELRAAAHRRSASF